MKTKNLVAQILAGFTVIITTVSTAYAIEPSVNVNTHPIHSLGYFQEYLPEDPVIIDAGAFDGQESAVLAQRWPQGRVHSFEPIPEIFVNLAQTASNVPNMSIYNFALGQEDGLSEMYVSELSNKPGVPFMSASLRAPKEHIDYAPHVLFPRSITVETFKIDTWAELNGIDRVDMMWLDMQGVELEVLKASPKILATTRVILTEVEFVEAYAGQYLYQDIKNWLEEQGFVMTWCNFNPYSPTQNGVWFGDALFVRKDLMADKG